MSRRAISRGTLVTLLTAGLIMTAFQIAGIVAEKKAIAAFEKLGGHVDGEENKPDLPKWIAWAWPASYLHLEYTKVTDSDLKKLAGLKSLQTLNLYGTQITDVALKELAALKSLEALNLFNTKVTDAGLKELAGLKSLHNMNLGATQVTDAGLRELAGLKDLQRLSLIATQVTDAGVAELRKALPECNIGR